MAELNLAIFSCGVQQGCVLSPVLFNYTVNWILGNVLHEVDGVEFVSSRQQTDPDYADDISLLPKALANLQSMVSRVNEIAESLNSMPQADLAARLTMNGLPDAVDVEGLQEADIIIIEVGDLDNSYREHFGSVNKAYPNAKVAHLELGGQFPFLSRAEEFAAYMEMHYESYHQTPFCPTANVDIDGDRI
nr:unnamed protein product [Spirometra erinaceieuropaei]